jgi:hypothetical protein
MKLQPWRPQPRIHSDCPIANGRPRARTVLHPPSDSRQRQLFQLVSVHPCRAVAHSYHTRRWCRRATGRSGMIDRGQPSPATPAVRQRERATRVQPARGARRRAATAPAEPPGNKSKSSTTRTSRPALNLDLELAMHNHVSIEVRLLMEGKPAHPAHVRPLAPVDVCHMPLLVVLATEAHAAVFAHVQLRG